MRVAFCTLGCKVNHYETQAMEELFRAEGYEIVSFEEPAQIYIVNTCTVTQISDKKSRQMLSRAHAQAPNALIVAVGCYAETARETVKQLEGVSLVIGTEGRRDIVSLCERALKGQSAEIDYPAPFARRKFEELSAVRDSRTRAVLKIQDGCNSFCSYCAIPFARGALRSRSIESCERELHSLAAGGYREVVLTGIQLSAYGVDLMGHPDLNDVIRLAASIPGIERIRLGSLEPRFVDKRFLETVKACPSLCCQFHLSLQSGSDSVLQRMNRRYTTEDYREAVKRLRETFPFVAITTDLIAGFVGESEEEHAETLAFVREIGFARIHVFPYSKRNGTKAASMPGHLPKRVKEDRCRELIRLGKELEEAFVDSMIGQTVSVLMEDDGTGYTGNYVRVRCDGAPGEIKNVTLIAREGVLAIGK